MRDSVSFVLGSLALTLVVTTGCPREPIEETETRPSAWDQVPERPLHTDHSTFFNQKLKTGPEVTRICLDCHPEAGGEVMKTAHWNWVGEEVKVPGHEEPVRIGKKNVINNFCIGIGSNQAACTTCHIGYGWKDDTFDFENQELIDCLVCHDNSGGYTKKPKGAGLPGDKVDLAASARSVGGPVRANCGACHFTGGGGNAVKHGDLDRSLLYPSARVDVHMGKLDLICTDCHRTEKHDIPGRSMSVSVDDKNRVKCQDCHEGAPHDDARLNSHTERVACQTCHIPRMAVKEATKMSWDWSEAGQDLEVDDKHVYMKIKGRFTYGKGVLPEFAWYNGTSTRYLVGDEIDPEEVTVIAGPQGDRDDPKAKIWPFKVHRGKQIYDTEYKTFQVPNVHGEEGFWTKFDWDLALRNASKVTGQPYSGSFDFAPTEMYWPLSHMVSPKADALQCLDCHGEGGRLDWEALGYDADPLGREPLEHDPVLLLDASETSVVESGEPLSMTATCSQCHELDDEDFVAQHAYHSGIDLKTLPPERAALMLLGPRLPTGDGEEMDCLLCHLAETDRAALLEMKEMKEGKETWTEAVAEEIELPLQHVAPKACGSCHGTVPGSDAPLRVQPGKAGWTTETTGQIFSGQRIRLSGMNLAGKDELSRSWDVHAARAVGCGDCHYAKGRPERLVGEVRAEAVAKAGSRRSCESCHSLEGLHTWLPERENHLSSVACESCHVPRLHLPARMQVDATVVWPDGEPVVLHRGLLDQAPGDPALTYVGGYSPLLTLALDDEGEPRVMPVNLISTHAWVDRKGEPVGEAILRAVFLRGGAHAPEIVKLLDQNGDGALAESELRLNTQARVDAIAARLTKLGIEGPRISGELRAYPIHHNVTHGEWANRDCETCHPKQPGEAFGLAEFLPAGQRPTLQGEGIELVGTIKKTRIGGLVLEPGDLAKAYRALVDAKAKGEK